MKVFRADGSLPLDEETDRFQDEANAMCVDDVITPGPGSGPALGMVVERSLPTLLDAIESVDRRGCGSGRRPARHRRPHVRHQPAHPGDGAHDMRVRTEFIHAAHNPLFGGMAPAPDLERLSALISMITGRGGRYDLGMATDGDSDRIGIVDETGEYVSTNDLLLLLYWYLHEVRGEAGAWCATSPRRTCSTGWRPTSASSPTSAGWVQVRHRRDGRDRRGARWRVFRRADHPRLDQGQGRHLRLRAGGGDARSHRQAHQRLAGDDLRDHREALCPRRERRPPPRRCVWPCLGVWRPSR